MAENSDSEAEVTFESADEGEHDDVVEEIAKENKDAAVPDSTQLQDHESTASTKGNSATDDTASESSKTEGSADESRTKTKDETEGAGDGKLDNEKSGGKVEDDVTQTERIATSDEACAEDAKDTGKTDHGDGAKGSAGDEKEQKEPEGEEIMDRGAAMTEDAESDAKAGGAPQNASAAPASSGGSWGWGGWGTSLLSSAAATVTKVSDNVGKGLTHVLENVETSLGVPKPEELREIEKREAEKVAKEKEEQSPRSNEDDQETNKEDSKEDEIEGKEKEEKEKPSAGLGGFFSSGASVLTSAMGKTVTGGLDALEMLGRKTMDILQDGDPRLEKKRGIIPKKDRINLSDVLRQAKEDAEAEAARQQEEEEHQKYNYSFLFDQYQGLAHLEALEMLSNQSETKVQTSISVVMDEKLDELKTELLEVRDAFQLEDLDAVDEDTTSDQDFVNVVTELLFTLSIAATPDKLQRVQKETRDWLASHTTQQKEDGEEDEKKTDIKEVHAKAMQTLAELTARTIEQFHKVGELMLLDQEKDQAKNKSPVEKATTLSKLASILSAEVSSVATKFCELLSSMGDKGSEEVNTIITNIYLEASNSTSYIQDAFQLLLPIMQDIVVTSKNSEETS